MFWSWFVWHFPRRAVPRRTAREKKGSGLFWGGFLGVVLAAACIFVLDGRIRPVMTSMASARVSNAAAAALNRAVTAYVDEAQIRYEDMVTLEKDGEGRITALTSNMAAMNRLRAEITDRALRDVSELDAQELSIPVGNLTNLAFLSGRGPGLPVRVLSVSAVSAAFQNDFSEAGINQTHHRIMLNLTVGVEILIPGKTVRAEVAGEVCVAETVIVGGVPGTIVQVGQ